MAVPAAGQRRWRRLGVSGVLAALLASLVVVLGGGTPASAASGVACPDVQWVSIGGRPIMFRGWVYTLYVVTPAFNVSDARTVDNTLDVPATATFTSQKSQTYTVTVNAGLSATFLKFVTLNVSGNIVKSRTTTIGVTATTTVAPHSRVDGLYGVEAYNITYSAHQYRVIGSLPDPGERKCIDEGVKDGSTNTPTNVEGWRLVAG
jgi:hypothetical protein